MSVFYGCYRVLFVLYWLLRFQTTDQITQISMAMRPECFLVIIPVLFISRWAGGLPLSSYSSLHLFFSFSSSLVWPVFASFKSIWAQKANMVIWFCINVIASKLRIKIKRRTSSFWLTYVYPFHGMIEKRNVDFVQVCLSDIGWMKLMLNIELASEFSWISHIITYRALSCRHRQTVSWITLELFALEKGVIKLPAVH